MANNSFFDDFVFGNQTPKDADDKKMKRDLTFDFTKTPSRDKRQAPGSTSKKSRNSNNFDSFMESDENKDISGDLSIINLFNGNEQLPKQDQTMTESEDLSLKRPQPDLMFNMMGEAAGDAGMEFFATNKPQEGETQCEKHISFAEPFAQDFQNPKARNQDSHFDFGVNDKFFSTNEPQREMKQSDGAHFNQQRDVPMKQREAPSKPTQKRRYVENQPMKIDVGSAETTPSFHECTVSTTMDGASNLKQPKIDGNIAISLKDVALEAGRESQKFFEDTANHLGQSQAYDLKILKELDDTIDEALKIEQKLRKEKETLLRQLMAMTNDLMDT